MVWPRNDSIFKVAQLIRRNIHSLVNITLVSLKRSDYVAALTIIIIIFSLQAVLAVHWSAYGVFDLNNVIFDTDSKAIKGKFAHGWSAGGFKHPLISFYFGIPIRFIVAVLSKVGLISDQVVAREILALYIPPVLSAIKAASFFFAFRLLGLLFVDAILVSLIAALGFSSLMFGSTPSSYVVSGCGLALMTLLALLNFHKASSAKKTGLVLCGLFSIGTTASNVIHYGWMTWMSRMSGENKPISELIRSVATAATMLLMTLLLSFILVFLRHGSTDLSNSMLSKENIERFKPSVSEHISNTVRFPEMLARSYIPSTPRQKHNDSTLKFDSPIKFELTYNSVELGLGSIMLWLVGLFILGGVVVSYKLGGIWRWAGAASAASILTTGVVFTWFGTNTYLYSQYWQVPGVILIGAWYYLLSHKCKYGRSLLAILLFFLVVGDAYVINEINSSIARSTY
jgi:hypothetical protein